MLEAKHEIRNPKSETADGAGPVKIEVPAVKKCKECRETKLVEEGFYRNSKAQDGYCSICKDCMRERKRRYRAKARENRKALAQKFAKKDVKTSASYSSNPAFDSLLKRMGRIHDAKRSDYASQQDPLGNFREAERFGISPVQGILVRMSDKWTRICNLAAKGGQRAVKDEALEDTLLDLANYALLCLIARQDEGIHKEAA